MKPFDLEAAKRGEPFTHTNCPDETDARFIGVRQNGEVVYERDARTGLQSAPPAWLRMLPRKQVRWGLMHEDRKGGYIATSLFLSESRCPTPSEGYHRVRVEWEE